MGDMVELHLKITIGDTDIDLQGEAEIVYKVFQELRKEGLGALQNKQTDLTPIKSEQLKNKEIESLHNEEKTLREEKTSRVRKRNNNKPPQLINSLDLSGKGVDRSLNEFVTQKIPTSNIERTTVFVYYLQNILQVTEITLDHIFTCYRYVNERVPKNLQQNLTDTASSRYGYIIGNDGNYTMSILGSNFIEHDLPKKR